MVVRTVWFTVAALVAALALTVAAPVASAGGDGCPGQYDPYVLSGVDDPHASVEQNGNGYICEYVGNGAKEPFVDDNHKPPKKSL
jgi:hypothetical protein